jgi:hypothetical protein
VSITSTGEPLTWLELQRGISVAEAAKLNGVSEDTFRREYPHLILQMSPRRDIVRLGNALNAGKPKNSTPTA